MLLSFEYCVGISKLTRSAYCQPESQRSDFLAIARQSRPREEGGGAVVLACMLAAEAKRTADWQPHAPPNKLPG